MGKYVSNETIERTYIFKVKATEFKHGLIENLLRSHFITYNGIHDTELKIEGQKELGKIKEE